MQSGKATRRTRTAVRVFDRGWSKADLIFGLIILASFAAIVVFKMNGRPAQTPQAFANHTTMSAASQRSDKSGKPLLILATASWCGPCQSFKRGALSDESVGQLITETTEPVYLDIDEHPDEARSLGINSIPTLILVRDGQVVSRTTGVMNVRQTKSWIQDALAKAKISQAG
ncbi:MAG TPA: thioredoxin [Phycisphaerales bacterium]|nr:thioredoxin [Phycisphaerales bacterium]